MGRAWQLKSANSTFPELAEEPDGKGDDLGTDLDKDAGISGLRKGVRELRNEKSTGATHLAVRKARLKLGAILGNIQQDSVVRSEINVHGEVDGKKGSLAGGVALNNVGDSSEPGSLVRLLIRHGVGVCLVETKLVSRADLAELPVVGACDWQRIIG